MLVRKKRGGKVERHGFGRESSSYLAALKLGKPSHVEQGAVPISGSTGEMNRV